MISGVLGFCCLFCLSFAGLFVLAFFRSCRFSGKGQQPADFPEETKSPVDKEDKAG